jgi:hypothetical protein
MGSINIPSGLWGIYQSETAYNNYFNGSVLIGTNAVTTHKLDVNGSARATIINSPSFKNPDDATSGNMSFFVTGAPGDAAYQRLSILAGGTPFSTIIQTSGDGGGSRGFIISASGPGGEMYFETSNSQRWILSGSYNVLGAGHLLPSSDNLYSIGASSTRISSIYSYKGFYSTNVQIGGNTEYSSSLLSMDSTTKGFLPPRMTTVQRDAIASPATGLQIYNSTTNENNTYNGTAWISEQATITNPVTGTGVSGQVAYFTGATTQAGNNNLFWDNTNGRLGIGTATPLHPLDVTSAGNTILYIRGGSATALSRLVFGTSANNNRGFIDYDNTSGARFMSFKTEETERMRITATNGNLHIGTFVSDSGQRLQVTGDTLLKGSGNTNATTALLVQNSDGGTISRFRNDGTLCNGGGVYSNLGSTSTNGFAGVNPDGTFTSVTSSDIAVRFTDNRTISNAGYSYWFSTIQYTNLTYVSGTGGFINVQRGFAPTSGTGVFNAMILQNTINQTGGANGITRGLYVNPTLTAAADWRSIEWSNNTGWGLYGAGTSNNYLGGSLGIGQTTLTGSNLRISKAHTGATSAINFYIDSVIQSDVTNSPKIIATTLSTQAASFTIPIVSHYYANQGTIGAGSTVTTQIGFQADNTLIGGTFNYGFYGNIPSGTNRWNLFMNGTADNYMAGRLGLGSTSLSLFNLRVSNAITGGTTAVSIYTDSVVQSDVTNIGTAYYSGLSTAAASFTLANLRHFYAEVGSFGAGSSVTTQVGFGVSSNLTGATNNYGFLGSIAAATGRYNLYMNGTADNYLAGNLGIGVTNPSLKLDVLGAIGARGSNYVASFDAGTGDGMFMQYFGTYGDLKTSANKYLSFTIGTNEAMRIASATRNVSIGATTDTGEKLQVNGTAKITGASGLSLLVGNTTETATTTPLVVSLGGTYGSNTAGSTSNIKLRLFDGGSAAAYYGFGVSASLLEIHSNNSIGFFTGGTTARTERMRIDLTGAATFSSSVTAGSFVQTGGTAAQILAANGSVITAGTNITISGGVISASGSGGITGTGVSGQVAFWNGSTSQTGTNNLFWDNTNSRLGVGTNTPSYPIDVNGSIRGNGNIISTGGGSFAIMQSTSTTIVTVIRASNGGANVMSSTAWGDNIAIGTELNTDLILATNNTERIRLKAAGHLQHITGTAPSSSSVDSYLQYSADVVAGNAAPHFRTENGAIIKLYQETPSVGNAIISTGGGSAVLDDTTFDGYTLRQLVRALRNQGLLQ